ncbi:MAG: CotH kinase family protein, partial [Deltaproteobacteria bacterium]|nr:CotH kinase family protein [Deltaproteobacteria bacterium]
VYINVERVDKVFLADRYGDDSGWLYKKSGGNGDGLKTHESDGLAGANPYDDYFCFWPSGGGAQPTCAAPADLATSLPQNLQIEQMLRFGAVNAMIANTDSPIFKNNNFYIYDWSGRRLYLPWDLDTCLTQATYSVFTGRGTGGEIDDYVNVLFSNWEGTYDQIITDLLADKLSVASVHAELDRVVSVA